MSTHDFPSNMFFELDGHRPRALKTYEAYVQS
jgi:hypothetical protein